MTKSTEGVKRFRARNPWYRPLEYAKRRCSDPKHREYFRYGGRGIKCFLTSKDAKMLYTRDNGDALKQPSLDRIDPDGNYTLENCRYIERVDNIKQRRQRIPKTVIADTEGICAADPDAGEWEVRRKMEQLKLPRGFPVDENTAISISAKVIVIAHPLARARIWNFKTQQWNVIKPKFKNAELSRMILDSHFRKRG